MHHHKVMINNLTITIPACPTLTVVGTCNTTCSEVTSKDRAMTIPVHLQMEAQTRQRMHLRERLCTREIAHEHAYLLQQTLHQAWHAYLIARCQHRD
jgi:hypothetical protein